MASFAYLLVALQLLSADATSIALTASPGAVSAAGGTATITAKVTNADGNPAADVPVGFSADNGSLSSEAVTTDQTGTVRVFLTTNKTANVTATAGAPATARSPAPGPSSRLTVSVSPLPTVSISATPPSSKASTSMSVTLTIRAIPATGNTIVSVLVAYGDGQVDSLHGNVTTVSHVYSAAGSYTVTATATDNLGGSGSADTTIAAGLGDDAG